MIETLTLIVMTFLVMVVTDCCCGRCCYPRCLPLTVDTETSTEVPGTCPHPLPLSLTCDLVATPDIGGTTCFNGSGSITFKTPLSGGDNCWDGTISGTCTDCNGNAFAWSVRIAACCATIANRWLVTMYPSAPCVAGEGLSSSVLVTATCDPVYMEGCFPDKIVGCFVGCLDGVTPSPTPQYTLCFALYEELP